MWNLSVTTDFGESEFKQITMSDHEIKTIEKIRQENKLQLPVVLEFGYSASSMNKDRNYRTWKYVSFDPTKKKASKARDAMETMIAMAENIKLEEIKALGATDKN